jgi:DNA polymerase-3 subunit epsilon
MVTPFYELPMLALDTETTGVDSFNDRIVTCSMVYDDGCGNQQERGWIIDPGIEIPIGASDVHGITTEIAQRDGGDAATAILEIAQSLWPMMTSGVPLVIYNAPFDLTLLMSEFARFGIDFQLPFNRVIDPLVIDKAVDKFRRGSRKLIDTAALYGYDLTNAHAADADNKASLHIARAVGRKYFTEDTTIEEIHELQIGWKAEQSASFQKYLRREKDPEAVIDGQWPLRLAA